MGEPKLLPALYIRALVRLFLRLHPQTGKRFIVDNVATTNPPPDHVLRALARRGLVTHEARPGALGHIRIDLTPTGLRALRDALDAGEG